MSTAPSHRGNGRNAVPFIPFRQVYTITCIDPRVEPAAIVGAQLGT
ncbi:MAG: hypothetical protein ACRDOI_11545 [Trebonia sp.]